MEIKYVQTKKFNTIKSSTLKNIISFLFPYENILVISKISKLFSTLIQTKYKKDDNINLCIRELKGVVKSLEEFKFITNNHCINLVENLKKFTETYTPFTFYTSIYFISSIILKDLQTLDVQKNNIGPDGLMLLNTLIRSSKVLLNLNLSYNSLQDEGCKFLAISLSKNTNLQALSLECNGITDLGLSYLTNPFLKHKHLKTIKFALNNVTLEGVKTLAAEMEANNSLNNQTEQNNNFNSSTHNSNQFNSSSNSLSNTINVIDFKYNNIVLKDENLNLIDYFRKNRISF